MKKNYRNLLLGCVFMLSLTACGPTSSPSGAPTETPTGVPTETPTEVPTETPTETPTTEPTSVWEPKEDDFTYYRETYINEEKHLYVFSNFDEVDSPAFTTHQISTALAIQGFYSRTAGKYYFQYQKDDFWKNDMIENHGFTFSRISFDDMVDDYKEEFGKTMVLYDAKDSESFNAARTIAGAIDALPVELSLKEYFTNRGFEMVADATSMSERQAFKLYKDYLNNDALVQISSIDHNHFLTDYGIANRYLFLWPQDMTDSDIMRFRFEAHEWCKDDAPIFGWCPNDEVTDINISSINGQFTLASDWCRNMSVFAAKSAFGELNLKQNNKDDKSIVAEQGKHYISIMMSDGDNIQTWYNTFVTSSKYMAAERADFKMSWSINPSLMDLGANVIDYVYRNQDVNDSFVCSVSGQGYMNPQVYPALDSFTSGMSPYLRKSDLSVVQILDSGPSKMVIDAYARVPELKGGIYSYGDRYAGGHGSVYWSNDKPFVAYRETLWNADVELVANRINNYSTNINSIEAYTAVNLHPWSMDYNDVVEMVSLLDDHVVVVTPDEMIRMITDNVPHEDVVLTV